MLRNVPIFWVVSTVGLGGAAWCFVTVERSSSGAYGSSAYNGIQVRGSDRFLEQITEALALVRRESPADFAIIAEHVEMIESSHRSGMRVARATCSLAPATAFHSLTWCAGSIAHEAYHSKLARQPGHSYGLAEEEQACIDYQLTVMKRLGAPREEIDYLASADGRHFDTNGDGRYTWADFHERDW